MVIGLTLLPRWSRPGNLVLQEVAAGAFDFADGAVDGGAGFDGHQDGGPGGPPGHAVLGEAPTRHHVVAVRVTCSCRPQVCKPQ